MHISLISLSCHLCPEAFVEMMEMIRRLPAFAMPRFNYCVWLAELYRGSTESQTLLRSQFSKPCHTRIWRSETCFRFVQKLRTDKMEVDIEKRAMWCLHMHSPWRCDRSANLKRIKTMIIIFGSLAVTDVTVPRNQGWELGRRAQEKMCLTVLVVCSDLVESSPCQTTLWETHCPCEADTARRQVHPIDQIKTKMCLRLRLCFHTCFYQLNRL